MDREPVHHHRQPQLRLAPRWLVVLSAAVVVAALWWRTERFVPDDAYFYLVVARNLARTGVQTFSGIFDTDGVHPLWTWVATAATWCLDRADSALPSSPRALLVVHHAALVASAWALAATARALNVSAWLAVVLPVAFVASVPVLHTEAPMSLLALAALLWAWVAQPRSLGAGLTVGLAAALTVFARLDQVFAAVALLVAWHVRSANRSAAVAAWLAAGLPVGLWLLWHRATFGAWMPVAGWLKSTWPAACPTGVSIGGITSALSGWNLAVGWLPLAAMAGALVAARRLPSELRTLVTALAAGTAVHAIQVVLFTHHPASWLWYYVTPVVGAAWALTLILHDRPTAARWLAAGCATLGALYAGWVALRPLRQLESARVVDWLDAQGITDATVLVSDGPGEIAFRTNNRILALDLLTSNPRLAGEVHAAADPLAPLVQVARAAGHPVTHVVHTTGTWLTSTRLADDASALQVGFLRPGACRGRKAGRLTLGAPLVHQHELTVWRVAEPVGQ